jgi:cyclopropane fatty-acyl-phospholipid synthase-like methyltransferase
MAVAPLGPMDPDLRALRGRVISLGCGHALVERYLAEINPEVIVDGVDLDARRVRIAQETERRSPRVKVRAADVTRLAVEDGYDAALAIDVLHHVPFANHAPILRALYACLKPGAVILVKEMATHPRRQYLWNRLHDRIVAGRERISCRSPEDMARLVEEAGFEVESNRRLKRLRIYPQYLVLARRPG